MRVAIVAPRPAAGTIGGAERAWRGLRAAIEAHTPYDAELVTLPVEELHLVDLVDAYRRFAALDLSRYDLVVTSKYPAWMVSHPNHVVYLFHPLRGLYDTYHLSRLPERARLREPVLDRVVQLARRPPERSRLDELFAAFDAAVRTVGREHPAFAIPGPLAREVVHHLDAVALDPASVRRHLALSRTVAGRPGYFPATVTPHVVHLPADLAPDPGPSPSAEDRRRAGLFTASRLDGPKRLDLVVRAMAHVGVEVALTIAGTGPDEDRLRRLARGDPRVRFLGEVGDAELAARYHRALAVPFVPADEDLGLITLEAMTAGTPVVTTTDAGGPTELVLNGVNGLVTAPEPSALARAFEHLASDPRWAAGLGAAGRRRAAEVTWEAVIAAVLGEPVSPPPTASGRAARPKVVVPSTYAIWPPRGGGQLRYLHLYGALAAHADVEIVSLVNPPRAASTVQIAPGLRETVVGVSPAHLAEDVRLSRATGIPTTDIVAGRSIHSSPAYLDALARSVAGADAVIVSHPFLLPALEAVDGGCRLPFVYDAHNAEADLKEAVLATNPIGRELAAWVADVEGRAVLGATHVVTCSLEDTEALSRRFGRSGDGFVVIPNGTDTARPVPTPEARRSRSEAWRRAWARSRRRRPARLEPDPEGVAIFLGSWHPPNLDAAEVVLELAAAVPEVVFVLAGSHSDHYRARRLPGNVVLAGVVSDAAKTTLLASADLALNPMRTGSGTNLKVVEYFAAGVPVVSTPFGIRGTDADRRHLLLVDPEGGIDALAGAVRCVWDDAEGAARRAAAARALAVERYDWRDLGQQLTEVVLDTVGSTGEARSGNGA